MKRRQRLLVADDDSSILVQLKWALEGVFDLSLARDPEQALARLNAGDAPDVALIDLHLPPDLSSIDGGIGLIRAIRRLSPKTRVFAFTSQPDEETERQSLEAGATAVLSKPVERDRLVEALKRIDSDEKKRRRTP